MTFEKILVALDGSKSSQTAAEYAFWLAYKLGSSVTGQHVVDPRLVNLFIAPEFGEELGLGKAVVTRERVLRALKKIGKVILKCFKEEGKRREIEIETRLDEGYIVEEIVEYSRKQDLVIMGHANYEDQRRPANLLIGSVAERVLTNAYCPVLIAVQPIEDLDEIVVAYDGSEASRGALLMGENLAKNSGVKLRAIIVLADEKKKSEAEFLVQQGNSFLRETWAEEVFSIEQGTPSATLLQSVKNTNSLLVIGAYGFKEPERNVLGSTAAKVVREIEKSILVYRPSLRMAEAAAKELEVEEPVEAVAI